MWCVFCCLTWISHVMQECLGLNQLTVLRQKLEIFSVKILAASNIDTNVVMFRNRLWQSALFVIWNHLESGTNQIKTTVNEHHVVKKLHNMYRALQWKSFVENHKEHTTARGEGFEHWCLSSATWMKRPCWNTINDPAMHMRGRGDQQSLKHVVDLNLQRRSANLEKSLLTAYIWLKLRHLVRWVSIQLLTDIVALECSGWRMCSRSPRIVPQERTCVLSTVKRNYSLSEYSRPSGCP